MAEGLAEESPRRRRPWRLVGHAAVTVALGGLVTFAVVGRGDAERGAGATDPAASPGMRSGVAGSTPRASATPRDAHASPSPGPAATPPPLVGRRLTFDDLDMGRVDAAWALSAVGVEVVAFPTAVDRGLQIGTRFEEGTGASRDGTLCVAAEGIGGAEASVRFDVFSPAALRDGMSVLSVEDAGADALTIDLADVAPLPAERWVRLELSLADDGIAGEAWLVDAPTPRLASRESVADDRRPPDADRVCIATHGAELTVDDLVIEP